MAGKGDHGHAETPHKKFGGRTSARRNIGRRVGSAFAAEAPMPDEACRGYAEGTLVILGRSVAKQEIASPSRNRDWLRRLGGV